MFSRGWAARQGGDQIGLGITDWHKYLVAQGNLLL